MAAKASGEGRGGGGGGGGGESALAVSDRRPANPRRGGQGGGGETSRRVTGKKKRERTAAIGCVMSPVSAEMSADGFRAVT